MRSPEKSVDQLREESERTRAALAASVVELRTRVGDTAAEIKTVVSPSHIKREIGNYVRQERESMVGAVRRNATQNPLQMAAIVAAVAYPTLALARLLPAPLWLIGAGLFLTSNRGQHLIGNVKTQIGSVVDEVAEGTADIAGSARDGLSKKLAGAREKLDEARGDVTSSAGELADRARTAFHDARDTSATAVQDGRSVAGDTAERIGAALSDTTNAVKKSVEGTARTSRTSIANFMDDNPLLAAGIGVAVGAIIAASIPTSEAENRLFGTGNEQLKEKARNFAAEGIERVGDIAAETAGAIAASAAREGLDAAGVQSALTKVADSVRAVAARGVATALGKRNSSQPIVGKCVT